MLCVCIKCILLSAFFLLGRILRSKNVAVNKTEALPSWCFDSGRWGWGCTIEATDNKKIIKLYGELDGDKYCQAEKTSIGNCLGGDLFLNRGLMTLETDQS